MEATCETLSQWSSSSLWRSCATNYIAVIDFHLDVLLSVVVVSMSTELSHQFNRWLCTVLLNLWHVDIVNHDDSFSTSWGTKKILSLSIQLTYDLGFSLDGGCSCGEGQHNWEDIMSIFHLR